MAGKQRVLAAVTDLGYVYVRRALANDFGLVPAFSMMQARAALKAGDIDAIVCSIHFDESRMFDLLRHVRSGGRNHSARMVCVLGHRFESPAISIEGLQIATRALAADAFVDLSHCAGPEDAGRALARILEPFITP